MATKLRHTHKPLQGKIKIPGDKSISHRSIMFASMAKGQTNISNFLDGEDCLRTVEIFRQLGVEIEIKGNEVQVNSKGMSEFVEPKQPLYFGNSGTTARLMIGLLAGLPFHTVMYGDPHLTVRPMDRVVNPLREMGAEIDGRGESGTLLPLAIRGNKLSAIDYKIPMKSAQVKSAILLAGLNSENGVSLTEQAKTRDHTERLMKYLGVSLKEDALSIELEANHNIIAKDIIVPGDISSAAFFITAAAIVKGSHITLQNVGVNETRSGIIDVIQAMNGDVRLNNQQLQNGEEIADIEIVQTDLKGTVVEGDIIPTLIDEIPLIALLATQAEGKTIIKDAKELRVKETDRIDAIVENLTKLGANVEGKEDGLIIHGPTPLQANKIESYFDHRMAMMGAVAALICNEDVEIDDVDCINISYPKFFEDLTCIM